MAKKSIYHNKKRNSALLYEFLIRHISKCLIEDNKEEANRAAAISKKYFSKGTALHEELKLFNSILKTKVKSKTSAQKIINEVLKASSNLNARKVDAEKSRLIKEINHTFDKQDVYSYKVPDYVVYASIQTLLLEERNRNKVLSSVDRIKLEDSVLDYLVKEVAAPEKIKTNPDYNNTVYKFVVERFKKKYDDKLTEGQKKLLSKYIVYLLSEDKQAMLKVIEEEVSRVKSSIREVKDKNLIEDADLAKKLKECYKKVVVTDFSNITEESIVDLMKFIQLSEEVQS